MKNILLSLSLLFGLNTFAAGVPAVFKAGIDLRDAALLKQIPTPINPASLFNKLYFKSDNNLYYLTSAGTETLVATGIALANPMTTGGDIIYGGGSGSPTRLANGTAGQVLTSNGTTLAPSWATITGTGTVTSVAASVPSFLSVSGSPITTSGTLAITLSGTALPIANGGTGATSATTAFNNLSPMTTGGDLIYGGASGAATRLANGSAGQVLTSGGTTAAPTWTTTVSSVGMTVPTFLSVAGSPVTSTGTLAVTLSGTALPIANGGTGVTSVPTSASGSAFAAWDASSNLSANNFIQGYATTATAAGTTTLTVASAGQQYFTGTTTQTVVMPVTSTLALGQKFIIVNNSSGVVTVQSSGGNTIQALAASTQLVATVIATSGTTAASWSGKYDGPGVTGTVTSVAMSVPSFLSVSGSPVTTSGTLAVTLSGTALPIANGGTGATSAAAAFNALSPMTTGGDIIYGGSSGAATRLANGSAGQVLTSAGTTAAPTWANAPSAWDQAGMLQNVSLSASVATNALTINLVGKNGSNPAANNAVVIAFRNATAATGTYTTVSQQAALSVVVPSSATLGQTSAVNQYVWVYALNDAGTMDLCVSGVNVFFNTTLNSSTAISSGSTSGTVLYCGSSHTGTKPTTIIGRLLVNESTAGTWASAPTEIHINPIVAATKTENTAFPNTTIGTNANCSTNMLCVNTGTTIPAYGSTTFNYASYYREGPFLYMDWYYAKTSGGTTQSTAIYMLFNVPSASGCTIDTTQTGSSAGTQLTNTASVGEFDETSTNSGTTYIIKGQLHAWSTTQLTADYVVTESAATANTGFWNAGNFMFTSAQNPTSVTLHAKVPCVGWSQYGP